MTRQEAINLMRDQYNDMWEALSNHHVLEFYPDIVSGDNDYMAEVWSTLEYGL